MRRRCVYDPYDGCICRPIGHPIPDWFRPPLVRRPDTFDTYF